jgi:hypothetical protein
MPRGDWSSDVALAAFSDGVEEGTWAERERADAARGGHSEAYEAMRNQATGYACGHVDATGPWLLRGQGAMPAAPGSQARENHPGAREGDRKTRALRRGSQSVVAGNCLR